MKRFIGNRKRSSDLKTHSLKLPLVISFESSVKEKETDSAAQGTVSLAVASGMSLATADQANPAVGHTPSPMKGLPLKQTFNDLSWGGRSRALARRVKLDRFNLTVRQKVSRSCLLNVNVSLLQRKQLLWRLRMEHGLLVGLKVSRSDLHFREDVRSLQT